MVQLLMKKQKRLDHLNDFNENQVKVLNALYMADEIFTGELKWYKLIDDECKLLRSKSNQTKSDKQPDTTDMPKIEEPDTTDMSDLESEESAAQGRNQQGKGLKILIPNQMLSRLPISLAQLKVGNNSEKLKNEIRKLMYSLYRSKKLTAQLYKSLIDII